jgi:hypothetical protein
VVFGHTPQVAGVRSFHDGRSLAIDTNACGNPRLPPGAHRELTLVRLSAAGPLAEAPRIVVTAADAAARPEPGRPA